jgi:hypothetical protein
MGTKTTDLVKAPTLAQLEDGFRQRLNLKSNLSRLIPNCSRRSSLNNIFKKLNFIRI